MNHIKELIREKCPLILFLTNTVSESLCANVTLAIGGSPLMCHEAQELQELIELCDALVINIGTLNDVFLERCMKAISFANLIKKPIVFDPVGAGASQYRTDASMLILQQAEKLIVKGNGSEILSLVENQHTTKGVDSTIDAEYSLESAQRLIDQYEIESVIITGKKDFVVSSTKILMNEHGHIMMTNVTGLGCALASSVALTKATSRNLQEDLYKMISHYGLCGELAALNSNGPGSFVGQLLDELAK